MNVTGALAASAQASLTAFCEGSAGLALSSGILGSLKGCAEGGLAASMDASASAALSAWLSGSSCSLSSELRGSVIAWMSFGVSADAGMTFSASTIAEISAGMSACVDMSATLKGALGVAVAGGCAGDISMAASAELSAWLLTAPTCLSGS